MSIQSSSQAANADPHFSAWSIRNRLSKPHKGSSAPGGKKPPKGQGNDIFKKHQKDRVSPASSYESLSEIPVYDDRGQPTQLGPHNMPKGAQVGVPGMVQKSGKLFYRLMIPKRQPSVPPKAPGEIIVGYIPGVASGPSALQQSQQPKELRFYPGSVIDSPSSSRLEQPSPRTEGRESRMRHAKAPVVEQNTAPVATLHRRRPEFFQGVDTPFAFPVPPDGDLQSCRRDETPPGQRSEGKRFRKNADGSYRAATPPGVISKAHPGERRSSNDSNYYQIE